MLRSVRQGSFEDFLDQTQSAGSIDEASEPFIGAMAQFGYDLVRFFVHRGPAVQAGPQRPAHPDTFPQAWRSYYQSRNLAHMDPVLWAACVVRQPFRWADLPRMFHLTREQIRFLQIAKDAGLHHALTVPLRGPDMQVAGISLAASVAAPVPQRNTDLIVAYCVQFYRTHLRLTSRRDEMMAEMTMLSPRECEILVRIGHGRTDRQIAGALAISVETVDKTMRRVFQKLDAPTRAAAVAKALIMGLISL